MNRILAFTLVAAALLLGMTESALGMVRVVTSINDLASIAASVGGDDVEVVAIARPNSDPHRVEVLPSYMVRAAKADLYLKVGLGLDGWADGIIDGSRNPHLRILDCSLGVPVLGKPTGPVNASMGDVHPNGNPHYWLDPRNGAIVARSIAGALSAVDPANAERFQERAEEFAKAAETTFERDRAVLAALTPRDIVTYHASWTYFAAAFELEVVATIEPVPGIPPTGHHLQELVDICKERGVAVVLQEPYFSDEAGKFLSRQTPVRIVVMPAECADAGAASYLAHFDDLAAALMNRSEP